GTAEITLRSSVDDQSLEIWVFTESGKAEVFREKENGASLGLGPEVEAKDNKTREMEVPSSLFNEDVVCSEKHDQHFLTFDCECVTCLSKRLKEEKRRLKLRNGQSYDSSSASGNFVS